MILFQNLGSDMLTIEQILCQTGRAFETLEYRGHDAFGIAFRTSDNPSLPLVVKVTGELDQWKKEVKGGKIILLI